MHKTKLILTPRLLRNFGLSTGGIFIALFGIMIPYIAEHTWPLWPWAIGLTLSIIAITKPSALKKVYIIWMKVGETLGRINTFILLTLIYAILFAPVGLITRLLKRDPLAYRYEPNLKTYRIKLQPRDASHMERPF
ncbi:MAG: SxtJ family membrane protein [Gammaproteobacteria bacterium]